MKFVKKFPVEWLIILILLIFVGFGWFVFFLRNISYPIFDVINPTAFLSDFFGGSYFNLPFIIIAFYFIAKFAVIFIVNNFRSFFSKQNQKLKLPLDYFRESKALWYDTLFTFLFLGISLALLSIFVKLLFVTALPEKIIENSNLFLNLDYRIFGSHFMFLVYGWFSSEFLEKITIYSYLNLFIILSGLFFILFFSKNKNLFRRFLFAFFISAIISLPFSFVFPALAPQHMFNKNILSVEVPPDVKNQFESITPSLTFNRFLNDTDSFWIDPESKFYAITAFPSMHAAWGIAALLIAFLIHPILGIILLPWCFFNLVGTVYTFQHYAVDTFAGIIVGVFAFFISGWLLRIEKNYYEGERSNLSLNSVVTADLKRIKIFVSAHKDSNLGPIA